MVRPKPLSFVCVCARVSTHEGVEASCHASGRAISYLVLSESLSPTPERRAVSAVTTSCAHHHSSSHASWASNSGPLAERASSQPCSVFRLLLHPTPSLVTE